MASERQLMILGMIAILSAVGIMSVVFEIQEDRKQSKQKIAPSTTCPTCRTCPTLQQKECQSPAPVTKIRSIDFSHYLHRAIPKFKIVPDHHFKAPIDIIVLWKYSFSKKWQVNPKVEEDEAEAWLNYAYPSFKKCGSNCAVWLMTAIDKGEWPKDVMKSFEDLRIPWAFMMGDMISKMLMHKFQERGEVMTIDIDADDFIEFSFYDQIIQIMQERRKKKPKAKELVCFRPKHYAKFWPYEKPPFYAPYKPGRALRIGMGVWARGIYNDAISINHVRFQDRKYIDCDLVKVNATGFYTQRKHSSSSKLGSYGNRPRGKKPWNGGKEFLLP